MDSRVTRSKDLLRRTHAGVAFNRHFEAARRQWFTDTPAHLRTTYYIAFYRIRAEIGSNGRTMTREVQKSSERQTLDVVLAALGLRPNQEPEAGETPDFIVPLPRRRIGVEVTMYSFHRHSRRCTAGAK